MMSFVQFLIFVALLQHGEAERHFKSIKITENIIYDCVDIYKQPAFDHPLLKDHKIQIRPSASITEPKTGVSKKGSKRKIGCPVGTVPILRTRKEDLIIAQQFAEKHFTPLTVDKPGAHIAAVSSQATGHFRYRGVGAAMSVHELNVAKDQASYAQTFIGRGDNGQTNVIQAGWMINPSLFGDTHTWSFGFWKGNNGAGCYNTLCPGFVQVATNDPLSEPMININFTKAVLRFSIHQDKQTGNWWISQIKTTGTTDIGYWPKELFNLIGDGATMVGFGGGVQASPSGLSPPMGNGHLPTGNIKESAYFTNLEITDSMYGTFRAENYPLSNFVDNETCYGLRYEGYRNEHVGDVFAYGGPGGVSCGV